MAADLLLKTSWQHLCRESLSLPLLLLLSLLRCLLLLALQVCGCASPPRRKSEACLRRKRYEAPKEAPRTEASLSKITGEILKYSAANTAAERKYLLVSASCRDITLAHFSA